MLPVPQLEILRLLGMGEPLSDAELAERLPNAAEVPSHTAELERQDLILRAAPSPGRWRITDAGREAWAMAQPDDGASWKPATE